MSVEAILEDLLRQAGWDDALLDRLHLEWDRKVLATPWPIAPMAMAVLAAVGLAASHIETLRTGKRPDVRLSSRAAELAMCSSSYLQRDGRNAKFRDPFTGFYPARNGEYVYLHGNFPHLRDGLLDMLGAGNDPEAVRLAVAARNASDIEAEAIERGLCAAKVRSREQWQATPLAAAVSDTPVLSVVSCGDAPRRVWPPTADGTALGRLKVLDFSRVIAGPMAGRTLAEHGATTMLVSRPDLPFIESLAIDTGFGKLSSYLDLRDPADYHTLLSLLDEADVFIDAYRPRSLGRRGLTRQAMFARRPGLVSIDLSAFPGGTGWAERRGYDSLVQATMGLTMPGRNGEPALLPCQPLDYLTGYLAAFGAMVALIRSVETGGNWAVDLSLAGTAQWMWTWRDRLGDDTDVPAANPAAEDIADLMAEYETPFGLVRALSPALQVGPVPQRWRRGPVRLGSDWPRWPADPR